MKIAVLLVEDAKQIMLTPENDHERSALKMIAPGDQIEAETKWGTFGEEDSLRGRHVGLNQAGYFRAWEDSESLMFIITKKESEEHDNATK
jgi:hypothetical protein